MKKNISSIIAIALAVGLFSFAVQGVLQVGTGFRISKGKKFRKKVSQKLSRIKKRSHTQAQPIKTISKIERVPVKKETQQVVKDALAKQALLRKIQQQKMKPKVFPTIGKVPENIRVKKRGFFGKIGSGVRWIGGGVKRGVSSAKDYIFKMKFVHSQLLKKGFSEGSSKLFTGIIMFAMGTIPGVSFVTIIPKVVGVLFKLWTMEGGWRARLGYLGKAGHKQTVALAFTEAGFPLIANTLADYTVDKGYAAIGSAWRTIRRIGRRKKEIEKPKEIKISDLPSAPDEKKELSL